MFVCFRNRIEKEKRTQPKPKTRNPAKPAQAAQVFPSPFDPNPSPAAPLAAQRPSSRCGPAPHHALPALSQSRSFPPHWASDQRPARSHVAQPAQRRSAARARPAQFTLAFRAFARTAFACPATDRPGPLVSGLPSTFLLPPRARTPLLRSARTPTARGPAPPRARARGPLASPSERPSLLEAAARAQDRAIRCPRSAFPTQNPAEITGTRLPSSYAEDHGLFLYFGPVSLPCASLFPYPRSQGQTTLCSRLAPPCRSSTPSRPRRPAAPPFLPSPSRAPPRARASP